MDKTRLWIIGSVLVMVVIGALGWIVGIQPQLDAATAASAQTAQVESGNAIKATLLAKMKKDSENLPKLKQQLADLSASVPSTADWPTFSDELSGFATSSGVVIVASTQGDGKPYSLPQADGAAAAPAAGGSGSGSTATPTPTPSSTPAPTATPAPAPVVGAPPVTSALITGENFTVVPVSVTARGGEKELLAFIEAVQTGKRLFLVNGLDINKAQAGEGFDAKLSGYIYVLTDPSKATTNK